MEDDDDSSGWYEDRCKLIQGAFATVLQFVLAALALSSLLFKRFRERPRRPWLTWGMDSAKQAVSMGTAHLTNMATAYVLSTVLGNNRSGSAHQCSWYLITFSFDCTLGSLSAFVGVRLMEFCARKLGVASLKHTGDYGVPPKASWFAAQLAMWVLIVVSGRVCNALLEWAAWTPLNTAASYIGYPLRNHPQLQLLLVMIFCPVVLNILQAWIQDQFLKRGKKAHELPSETAPLLGATGRKASINSDVSASTMVIDGTTATLSPMSQSTTTTIVVTTDPDPPMSPSISPHQELQAAVVLSSTEEAESCDDLPSSDQR